jgi:hypothetical protein
MGAFFRTGLVAGEHCMIAVDTADPDDILAAIGSPAELAGWEKAGRLTIRTATTRPANRSGDVGGLPTWRTWPPWW